MAMPLRPAATRSGSAKNHVRRKMTEQEKIEYRRRRLLRACTACASSKRKCIHVQQDRASRPAHERSGASDELFHSPGLVTNLRTSVELTSGSVYEYSRTEPGDNSQQEHHSSAPATQQHPVELEDDSSRDSSVSTDGNELCLYKPQSAESLSVMLFAENVEWAGVADSWFGEAPARLGHDACYDLAIDALMMVCWYGRKLPGATPAKVYRAMGASLDALHLAMKKDGAVLNDHILTTVAALSPVDAIATGSCFLVSVIPGKTLSSSLEALANRLARRH